MLQRIAGCHESSHSWCAISSEPSLEIPPLSRYEVREILHADPAADTLRTWLLLGIATVSSGSPSRGLSPCSSIHTQASLGLHIHDLLEDIALSVSSQLFSPLLLLPLLLNICFTCVDETGIHDQPLGLFLYIFGLGASSTGICRSSDYVYTSRD